MPDYDYIRSGDAIYERSFAIIRSEADLSRFSPEEAEIAVRMIHACGMVEAAQHFEFSADFVDAARGALQEGAPIFCDAEMVAHGVTRARLPAKNEVICTLRDPRTPELATRNRQYAFGGRNRALARCGWRAASLRSAMRRRHSSICSNCCATARRNRLRSSACRSVSSAPPNPRMRSRRIPMACPYAIVRGRLGGSAMTAAAINALARPGL